MDKLTEDFLEKINKTIDNNIQLEESDFLEFFFQLYCLYQGYDPDKEQAITDKKLINYLNFIIRRINITYDFYTKDTMKRPNAFTLGAIWAATRFLDIIDAYELTLKQHRIKDLE